MKLFASACGLLSRSWHEEGLMQRAGDEGAYKVSLISPREGTRTTTALLLL